jgi:hypothetical protein
VKNNLEEVQNIPEGAPVQNQLSFQVPTADKYPALFFSHHPYFHELFKREAMFKSGKVLQQ